MAKAPKPDIPVWVLNVPGDVERRRFMERQLSRLGVEYEIIEAVDKRAIPPRQWRRYSEEEAVRVAGREVSIGEVACFLSHIRLWERLAAGAAAEALIMEDDAGVGASLFGVLKNRHKLPGDYERICFYTDGHLKPFGGFVSGLHRAARYRVLADHNLAYLLTAAGAKKLLEQVDSLCMPLDAFMGVDSPTGKSRTGIVNYGIFPAVAHIALFSSSIHGEGVSTRGPLHKRLWHSWFPLLRDLMRCTGLWALLRPAARWLRGKRGA